MHRTQFKGDIQYNAHLQIQTWIQGFYLNMFTCFKVKKTFLYICCLKKPVFPLCLKHFVLAPIFIKSLRQKNSFFETISPPDSLHKSDRVFYSVLWVRYPNECAQTKC